MMKKAYVLFVLFMSALLMPTTVVADNSLDRWSDTEKAFIRSLLIDNLGLPPYDPSNEYADNLAAAKLGERIFNDPRFSANNKISCSSCHRSDYNFTDELPVAKGLGVTSRRSMPIVGMAYQHWFFWDGRKDSLWSQALAPFENVDEHGISRTWVAQLIFKYYYKDYQKAIAPLANIKLTHFPSLARPSTQDPVANEQWQAIAKADREIITRIYVNVGKALAAFVRTLKPSPAAFDLYARALTNKNVKDLNSLSSQQKKGLRLFIGKAKCISCHNGPLLSNGEFHHVGAPHRGTTDFGRAIIVKTIVKNEFSCMSLWSDADPETDCAHVRFLDADAARYLYAFKTPSLRNVAIRPPYMHAGQFDTLANVLKHYRNVSETAQVDEIFHSDLSDDELEQLEAFLKALTSLEKE